ncbi:MAG TPA: hypothetical protein VGK20_16845 [Candidatus Binatia bacterium]
MSSRRPRSIAVRALIAALALWLPAATGQGGRAVGLATATLAVRVSGHAHLSCHGDSKDCCCKNQVTLRSGLCGCHDGATAPALTDDDPMLAAAVFAPEPAVAAARCGDAAPVVSLSPVVAPPDRPPQAPPPSPFA